MKSGRIDRLINEVSLETGYSKSKVREMWMAQWGYLRHMISNADRYNVDFDHLMVTGLGKFYVRRRQKRYFTTLKARREEALLPDVYVGQRFDIFRKSDWHWMGEAFAYDVVPLYIGNKRYKEKFPRVMQYVDRPVRFSGLVYYRVPTNTKERDGYI